MKRRLLAGMISASLAVAVAIIPATKTAYAQCGCSCAMVCDNKCQFYCEGCGFIEGVSAASRCCREAQTAIGDTGPCLEEESAH